MQIDMHFYATYCLARIAGINQETSHIIAYSAQYVDDNTARNVEDHEDGGKIIAVPTAHHVTNIRNRSHEDQRYIWVPFHFIPGNEGDTWTERMICRKDSKIAQEMVSNNCSNQENYHAELMGITAHVYTDTFSHYRFSGVSSRRNRVRGDSFKLKQSESIVRNAMGKSLGEWFNKYGNQGGLLSNIRSIISGFGEAYSGALGHGSVSVYPDMPFLVWSYIPEFPEKSNRVIRNNPGTFLEGCGKLYEAFVRYAESHPEVQDKKSYRRWYANEQRVKKILAGTGDKLHRSGVWKLAAESGEFGFKEIIPEYNSLSWEKEWSGFSGVSTSSNMYDFSVYRFMQAASYHRHYVLRELLPKHGLIVI